MLFFDGGSTKTQIFNALCSEPHLTAKQLFGKIVGKRRRITYQAIHKALKQMVEEKVVEKKNTKYCLNMKRIRKIKQKIIELEEKQNLINCHNKASRLK